MLLWFYVKKCIKGPSVGFWLAELQNKYKYILIITDTISIGEGDSLSVAGLEEGEEEEEGDDDHAEFHTGESSGRATIQPRWPTRVFAAECVRRIVVACQACRNTPAHFDLAIAKEMQLTKSRGLL